MSDGTFSDVALKYSTKNVLGRNDDLVFYVPFNIIEVISRRWKDDNERFCVVSAVHS